MHFVDSFNLISFIVIIRAAVAFSFSKSFLITHPCYESFTYNLTFVCTNLKDLVALYAVWTDFADNI